MAVEQLGDASVPQNGLSAKERAAELLLHTDRYDCTLLKRIKHYFDISQYLEKLYCGERKLTFYFCLLKKLFNNCYNNKLKLTIIIMLYLLGRLQ